MSTSGPSDDEANWRDAAERATEIPSDSELSGPTRAVLIVIVLGLSMAIVAVAVFFGVPAALDTLPVSIAMTVLLVALMVIGGWAFVKRFRTFSRPRLVTTPLTPPQRRLLRAHVRNPTKPSTIPSAVVAGHLRQQRQVLLTIGMFAGFWVGLAAYSIVNSHPSKLTAFWFCYLIGGTLTLAVATLMYRRYGTALRRVAAAAIGG